MCAGGFCWCCEQPGANKQTPPRGLWESGARAVTPPLDGPGHVREGFNQWVYNNMAQTRTDHVHVPIGRTSSPPAVFDGELKPVVSQITDLDPSVRSDASQVQDLAFAVVVPLLQLGCRCGNPRNDALLVACGVSLTSSCCERTLSAWGGSFLARSNFHTRLHGGDWF